MSIEDTLIGTTSAQEFANANLQSKDTASSVEQLKDQEIPTKEQERAREVGEKIKGGIGRFTNKFNSIIGSVKGFGSRISEYAKRSGVDIKEAVSADMQVRQGNAEHNIGSAIIKAENLGQNAVKTATEVGASCTASYDTWKSGCRDWVAATKGKVERSTMAFQDASLIMRVLNETGVSLVDKPANSNEAIEVNHQAEISAVNDKYETIKLQRLNAEILLTEYRQKQTRNRQRKAEPIAQAASL